MVPNQHSEQAKGRFTSPNSVGALASRQNDCLRQSAWLAREIARCVCAQSLHIRNSWSRAKKMQCRKAGPVRSVKKVSRLCFAQCVEESQGRKGLGIPGHSVYKASLSQMLLKTRSARSLDWQLILLTPLVGQLQDPYRRPG